MKYFYFLLVFTLLGKFVSAQSGVNVVFTEFSAPVISPIISTSESNPLRMYNISKTINGLSFNEYVNGTFLMPSYYQNNLVNRTDKIIYYGRTGTGPSVSLYYLPYVKVFKRYIYRDASWFNQDDHELREVWLQFSNEINGSQSTGTGNSTVSPSPNATFDIKLKYKLISTFRVRNSNNWNESRFDALSAPPNVGSYNCDERNEKAWESADVFKIVSQEAKWFNIDESLMQLTLCKQGQTINLYDYFTDKANVSFALDGSPLAGNLLDIGTLNTGNHTLSATKVYDNGTFSEDITLKIINTPSAEVTITKTSFCEGTTSTLSAPEAPSGEVYTYSWSNGATTRNITVSQTFSGTVTVSNGFCSKISEPVSATLMPAPKPSIQNQTGNNNICDGQTAVLVTNQVAQSYNWINQDNEIVGYQQAYYAMTAGTYKVTAFYENGCSNTSDPVTITVSPNPAPTIIVTGDLEFCDGGSVTLTAQLPNNQIAQNFQWSDGQTGQTVTVTKAGIYTVTARNTNGCSRISEPLVIKTKSNPKPLVTVNGALKFCEGGSVKLTVTNAQQATKIIWSNGVEGLSTTVNESGNYFVTVYRGDCENTSEEIQVEVYPNIKPVISALGSTQICQGDIVTLQVTNPQPNTTYSWSNGQTGLQAQISTTGNIYVIASNSQCFSNSDPILITVNPIQKPLISLSGASTFCEGGSVTLTVTNPTGADEVRWSNGDVGNSTTVYQSGNFYATIKKGDCERISDEIEIKVTPNAKPIIETIGSNTICEGESVTLQVTNPQPNTIYNWNNGQTGLQLITKDRGNYFVIATNNGNCSRVSDQISINVTPIAKPTISIDNETTICQGDSIVLTINEVATNYRWSNGATGKSTTIKNGGVYTAFISNGDCERASDPMQIIVKPNNKIAISQMGSTEFCEGDSLVLSVINNGTFLWNTGESTRSIKITKSGQYSVMVTNQSGCISNSETYNVVVRPLPKPTVSVIGQTILCEGDSVVLTINQTAAAYRWSSGENTKSITAKIGANYTAYISNSYGCERASDPILITVNPNPKPQVNIIGQTTFCETDSVILYVTPIAGMKYTWSNGVIGNSTVIKGSGNFYVTSTTPNNCSSISNTVNVVVHPLPKPTIHLTGQTTICEGDSVILTINQTGTAYRWSNGEKTKSIIAKIGASYTAYISNGYGCERASDPILITVNPNPKPTISYTKLTVCDGDSVKLSASNGMSFLWSSGETTKDIWVKNPNDYYVIVTNSYGCSNRSEPVKVNILPNEVPRITSSNGTEFCKGGKTTLTASEAKLYRWSTGETTQSIVATTSGKYTVTVINDNNCERTSLPFEITVNNPTVLTTIPDQPICLNAPDLSLDGINTNPLGGAYSGKGIILNKFNPQSAGAGTHIITYTYLNAKGCQSQTTFKIEVIPLVELPVGADVTVCLNDNKILLINDNLPVGTVISGKGVEGSEFNPVLAGVGRHIITYTYVNQSTCTTVVTRVITVNPIPTAPVITGNNMTCNNTTLTLTAKSTVISDKQIFYRWYKENAIEPFAEGGTIRYVVNGSERLYCEAYTEQCPSPRTEIAIFSLTPHIRISATATQVLQGTPVSFTLEDIAGGNPSVKWEWTFGDSFTSSEKSPKHYYNKPGIYTVTVRAYSAEGCMIETKEVNYIVVQEDPIGGGRPVDPSEPVVDLNPYLNTVIYPNPVKGGLAKLRVNNSKNAPVKGQLHIYTVNGRLLLTQKLILENGQNDIDINNLQTLVANSYYLFVVRIEGEKDYKTLKVLIL